MYSPFRSFEPLQAAALHEEVFAAFALTFVVQALVIAGAILQVARKRRAGALPAKGWSFPRPPNLLVGRSRAEQGLWALPLLTWAAQATLRNGSFFEMLASSHGPALWETAIVLFYSLLALGIVLTVQTAATLVLDSGGPPLGLPPRYRTAVVFAFLPVVWLPCFVLWVGYSRCWICL